MEQEPNSWGTVMSAFNGILGLRESEGLRDLKKKKIFHSGSGNPTRDNSVLHKVKLNMLFI